MNALLNLNFDAQGDLLESARQCEEDVFLQAFGNTRAQLDEEYGPYDDQSVFVAVSDDAGHVVGACRLITPGSAGLKTLNDVSRQPWGIDGLRSASAAARSTQTDAWDIATLGVRPGYRGSKLMVGLSIYHAIVVSTRINEVARPRRSSTSSPSRPPGAGYILPTLPGTRPAPYLGSPSQHPGVTATGPAWRMRSAG